MILVTGATGTIGSQVVRQLTVPFRAMSRRPSDLPGAVVADYDDPASLAAAVEGVTAVFLVTAPGSPTPRHDEALLSAAARAGVAKVVKLSAIGSGVHFGDGVVGAWHHAAEQAVEAVEASGMAWTILRPPSFASNMLWHAALVRAGEPLPSLTGQGRQPIIDPRDVAAVAVAALTTDEHDGRRYDLTGPELLTFAEQAAVLSRVLGRPVPVKEFSALEAREQLLASGMPEAAVATMSTGLAWARADGAAYVTDVVPQVLGRAAGSFEGWVRDHRQAFE